MSPLDGGSDAGGCSEAAECDDENPCSLDACDAGECSHAPVTDDPSCSCTVASECEQLPPDDECRSRVCDEGVCALSYAASGTPRNDAQQTIGDCQLLVCDGAGNSESIDDDEDVPDDGLECTADLCDGGAPDNPPLEQGSECTAGECNGRGGCAGCSEPADCGGESTFCRAVTCDDAVCGIDNTAADTMLPAGEQIDGDCQRLQCDGRGNIQIIAVDEDLPIDDGNDCTDEVCEAGTASHPDLPPDTACESDDGVVCDGQGTCVGCNSTAQCPAAVAQCSVAACLDGSCTTVLADAGAECDDGSFCNGADACNAAGACIPGTTNPCPGAADDDSDCSEMCDENANDCDGNDPPGSACSDGLWCTGGNAGDTCNAAGNCIPGNDPCDGTDSDIDCTETCNEAADSCSAADPDNTVCHDANSCTNNDDCDGGVCAGSNLPNGTTCSACSTCSGGSCIYQCNAATEFCCLDASPHCHPNGLGGCAA